MESNLSESEKSKTVKCQTNNNNMNKKWRTDYSSLLKCWSLIKTSDLIKEIAYKELKQFRANDKAIHRLKSILERNEYKSSFDQTISLWNKAIDQFINQKNYFAAAECSENLAEIELKYGKGDKKESICKLVKASTYYRRCAQYKRSITALKRAIIIAEFTQTNNFNFIVQSYDECSNMYERLNLHHLAKISLKTSKFFDKQQKSITSQQQMIEHTIPSRASTPSTIPIDSEDEESLDFEESVEHNMSRGYESSSDSSNSDISSKLETNIKRKKLTSFAVKSETTGTSSSRTASKIWVSNKDSNCERKQLYYNNRKNEMKSKPLLPQNLKLITNSTHVMNNSDSYDSDDSNDSHLYKPVKQLTKCVPQKCLSKQLTDNIHQNRSEMSPKQNPIKSEQLKSRKRKLKPKENSEELPEKRLIKLMKKGLAHNFVVDFNMPLERLFCTACEESIFSYRWSIITDHLKSQKHREFSVNNQESNNMNELTQNNVKCKASTNIMPFSNENIGQNVSVVELGLNYEFIDIIGISDTCTETTLGKVIVNNQGFDSNISTEEFDAEQYCEPKRLEQNSEEEESLAMVSKSYRSLDTPPSIVKTPEPQSIDSPFY